MKNYRLIVEKGPVYRKPVGSGFWINMAEQLFIFPNGIARFIPVQPPGAVLLSDLMELYYVK